MHDGEAVAFALSSENYGELVETDEEVTRQIEWHQRLVRHFLLECSSIHRVCVKLFRNWYRRKSEKTKLLVVLFVERVSNEHGDF